MRTPEKFPGISRVRPKKGQTSVRYQGTHPDYCDLRERIKILALERRRSGYRPLHILLRREGHAVNR